MALTPSDFIRINLNSDQSDRNNEAANRKSEDNMNEPAAKKFKVYRPSDLVTAEKLKGPDEQINQDKVIDDEQMEVQKSESQSEDANQDDKQIGEPLPTNQSIEVDIPSEWYHCAKNCSDQ